MERRTIHSAAAAHPAERRLALLFIWYTLKRSRKGRLKRSSSSYCPTVPAPVPLSSSISIPQSLVCIFSIRFNSLPIQFRFNLISINSALKGGYWAMIIISKNKINIISAFVTHLPLQGPFSAVFVAAKERKGQINNILSFYQAPPLGHGKLLLLFIQQKQRFLCPILNLRGHCNILW